MINTSNVLNRVRRLLKDTDTASPDNTDTDIIEYIKDSNDTIGMLYPDFTKYIVDSTDITPEPDRFDAQLIAICAVKLILMADIIVASGDAILIQTGDIKLDTSKAPVNLVKTYEFFNKLFENTIDSLIINGKSTDTVGIGHRVDTYIRDRNSTKSGNSLI